MSQGGDWTGNVYDFYFRVYNLMKQALKLPFQIEGITRIDDTPAHRALREALANCLTNANYHERRGVVCLWEEDALRISNPGDFRVDIEAALQGGESDPRNENMLRMFSYIDVGERAGSGLPKIMEGWKECGYDVPTYKETFGPDRTTLTLPLTPVGIAVDSNSSSFDSSESDESSKRTGGSHGRIANGGKDSADFQNRRKESAERIGGKVAINKDNIVAFIESSGEASPAKIADELGMGASRTRQLLGELVSEGRLVAEGSTRNRMYRIAEGYGED